MSNVSRVFVEKKPGFDVEAQHIREDLVHSLGLGSITALRLINRYDVSGLTAESAKTTGATLGTDQRVVCGGYF